MSSHPFGKPDKMSDTQKAIYFFTGVAIGCEIVVKVIQVYKKHSDALAKDPE